MSFVEPITSLEDPIEQVIEDPYRTRLFAFGAVIVIAMLALAAQLYRLQIAEGQKYRNYADNNRFRILHVEAPRGVIYDRNGILMVRNRPSYTVGVIPADLPKQPEAILRRVEAVLGLPDGEALRQFRERTTDQFTLIPLKTNVDEPTAFLLEERHLDLPGVHVVIQPIREYLDGPLTSHILGYVGPINREQFEDLRKFVEKRYGLLDRVGQSGIEQGFEPDLRGIPGERRIEVDVTGREVRRLGVDSPKPGHNLVLTIDLDLQRALATALAERLDRYETASAVALQPATGEVLALIHLPAYDNNLFARGIPQADFAALLADPRNPLLNGAIGGTYLPGAPFQTVIAAGGLQEGIIGPRTLIDCPGSLLAPSRFDPTVNTEFPDRGAFGRQDVVAALGNGCNAFFYQVGGGEPTGKFAGLGVDRIAHYARLLGFISLGGIGLPGEASGFFPSPEWKQRTYDEIWYHGDTYLVSVGQAYLTVTPLQMAQLAALVANGGTLYRPQLVRKIVDDQDQIVRTFRPEVVRAVPLDAAHWSLLQEGWKAGMAIGQTPNGARYQGTAYFPGATDMRLAGHAATAERAAIDASGKLLNHGWFVGYAPSDVPEVALAIFLRRGSREEAVQIAESVFRNYFRVAPPPYIPPRSGGSTHGQH
ncbi:MAG: penicillin-binding protein 2 [Chloroflexi bacterium]|nr:penicillin-binding protein 2 [Chloroflexota bacterium]